jgi:hypothetical protein
MAGSPLNICSLKGYKSSDAETMLQLECRELAANVVKILQLSTKFTEKSSLEEVCVAFKKRLPDAAAGKSIVVDESVHTEVCNKLYELLCEDSSVSDSSDVCQSMKVCMAEKIKKHMGDLEGLLVSMSEHAELKECADKIQKCKRELEELLEKCSTQDPVCNLGTEEFSVKLSNALQSSGCVVFACSMVHKLYCELSEMIPDELCQEEKEGGFIGGAPEREGLGFAELLSDRVVPKVESVYEGRVHADKRSLGREMQTRERGRERLFRHLSSQIKSCYDDIISNLYKLGRKIGTEIKINDKLRTFIRQLGYFEGVQPDRANLHKALSGYRRDVNSLYEKHDFMTSLESILHACKDLDSPVAKSLCASIERLLNVIDKFNKDHSTEMSSFEMDRLSIPENLPRKGGEEHEGDAEGGSADSVMGVLSELEGFIGGSDDFKYLTTMKKAIREIEYYYKIGNIKANLKVAASQSSEYTKDYANILGEECGILINRINQKFALLTCETPDQQFDYVGAPPPSQCIAYSKIRGSDATDKVKEERWKAFKFALEYIRDAKVEMIEASQALDLYLSKFTQRIQTNPDEVKDFLKLLEQIEIVAKWFTFCI